MEKNYNDPSLFFNKFWQGILLGFVLPSVIFIIYYFFRFDNFDFGNYLKYLGESKKVVSVLSLTVLPNLAPFMLMMNSNRFSSGRGVLTSTVILGVLVFILKFTL